MTDHLLGFWTFIVVVVLNLAGLVLDALLAVWGQPTITQRVWALPLLGAPILFLQVAGVAGLAIHFYGSR